MALAALAHGLATDADETGALIDALEQQVKAIATLPLATILDPLRRAVRDLCRTLRKEARLSIVGAEMSLDRRILDALKGPLVHIVRNCVDHGIEQPDERVARGKHREGAITIRAEQHGNLLVLEVEDDGNGLDVDRIRAHAIECGLITQDDVDRMSERELQQLVFRPGFSTRPEVGEVSGRGIGLDIVRSRVQGLAGTIELHSALRQGTRFVLTIPADLGSTAVLVVSCDDHQLGLPMLAIETLRAIQANDIKTGRSTVRLEHNGQLIPLHDLGAIMGLRPAMAPVAGMPALVIAARGRRIALTVDELIGDRDLVVRPLPLEIKELPAYLGAATLAQGELLLVLSPEFLTDARAAEARTAVARRVLVVDDSLAARALHRTILESGAYAVDTVGSARQALEHLRHAWYDAIVADVRMAGMDGFDLVAELRSRKELHQMPVVLVSAHDSDADRARGIAAGADVFLSKKECISGRLLSEVGALIARKERT
jgi:chemotaxis protein histidine kinase CheA